MAAITRAAVITASTRNFAPQREQRLTSISKTRRRRWAQLIWARVASHFLRLGAIAHRRGRRGGHDQATVARGVERSPK